MKKSIKVLCVILMAVVLLCSCSNVFSAVSTLANLSEYDSSQSASSGSVPSKTENGYTLNTVSGHGQLNITDGKLVNKYGNPVRLKGMSSHGLAWFPEFTSYAALKTTQDYGANVFRIAMYSAENEGYSTNRSMNEKLMYLAIENAIACDMYAIVDWHIREDANPLTNIGLAAEFFADVSARYANSSAIIYEICNEPGPGVPWADIKTYAEQIIPIIRKNSPSAIIVVGTPDVCTNFTDVIKEPLAYSNIMYTYHYYADTDGFESILQQVIDAGLAIFVTEWGLTPNKATGEVNWLLAKRFEDFTELHQISWTNWSLCNKDEFYSAIKPDCKKLSGWRPEDLTVSGVYFFGMMKSHL